MPKGLERDRKLESDILAEYLAGRDFYYEEREAKKERRQFYAGIQYTSNHKSYLSVRNRPILIFNHLQQHIDTISGTQRANKTDAVAKPFQPEDIPRAHVINMLLQHHKHASNLQFLEPVVFEDSLVDSTGWYDIRLVPDDNYETQIKVYRGEGLDIYVDPNCVEMNLEDCNYIIKAPWISYDNLLMLYPKKAAEIKKYIKLDSNVFNNVTETSDPDDRLINETRDDLYDTDGRNLRVIERWKFKYNYETKVLNRTDDRLWTIKGDVADKKVQRFMSNYGSDPNLAVFQKRLKTLWVDTWAGGMIVEHSEYPVQTGHFPLIPMYCYKKARFKWSVAANLLDYQREINKRRSSMLNIIVKNSSPRWIAEEGAIDLEQWLAPTDIKFVTGDLKRVQKIDEPKMPSGLWQYDQLMVGDMQHVGQSFASQGMSETSQESGRALGMKISQSNVRVTGILDNARLAKKLMCEELIRTSQKIMTEPQVLRIMDEDGKTYFQQINTTWDNDITVGAYDVVMDEAQSSANAMEYYSSMLLQAFGTMAQRGIPVQMLPWDKAMEGINHPKKQEIINRVAQALAAINGGSPQGGPGSVGANSAPPIQSPQRFAQADGGPRAT